jgi:hypothetical protein
MAAVPDLFMMPVAVAVFMHLGGLVFDLVGALYSHLKVGDPASVWLFPVIGLLLVVGSYRSFRYQLQHESGTLRNVLVPKHVTRAAGSLSGSVSRSVVADRSTGLRNRGSSRSAVS